MEFNRVHNLQRDESYRLNKIISKPPQLAKLSVPKKPEYEFQKNFFVKMPPVDIMMKRKTGDLSALLSKPSVPDFDFQMSMSPFNPSDKDNTLLKMSLDQLKESRKDNDKHMKILKGEIESGNNNVKLLRQYAELEDMKKKLNIDYKEENEMMRKEGVRARTLRNYNTEERKFHKANFENDFNTNKIDLMQKQIYNNELMDQFVEYVPPIIDSQRPSFHLSPTEDENNPSIVEETHPEHIHLIKKNPQNIFQSEQTNVEQSSRFLRASREYDNQQLAEYNPPPSLNNESVEAKQVPILPAPLAEVNNLLTQPEAEQPRQHVEEQLVGETDEDLNSTHEKKEEKNYSENSEISQPNPNIEEVNKTLDSYIEIASRHSDQKTLNDIANNIQSLKITTPVQTEKYNKLLDIINSKYTPPKLEFKKNGNSYDVDDDYIMENNNIQYYKKIFEDYKRSYPVVNMAELIDEFELAPTTNTKYRADFIKFVQEDNKKHFGENKLSPGAIKYINSIKKYINKIKIEEAKPSKKVKAKK